MMWSLRRTRSIRCDRCGKFCFTIVCDPCFEAIVENLRSNLEFDMRPPVNEEFIGVSNKEKHATIEARRDTVLAECNPNIPTYKPV